jgi:hypothetical protein
LIAVNPVILLFDGFAPGKNNPTAKIQLGSSTKFKMGCKTENLGLTAHTTFSSYFVANCLCLHTEPQDL